MTTAVARKNLAPGIKRSHVNLCASIVKASADKNFTVRVHQVGSRCLSRGINLGTDLLAAKQLVRAIEDGSRTWDSLPFDAGLGLDHCALHRTALLPPRQQEQAAQVAARVQANMKLTSMPKVSRIAGALMSANFTKAQIGAYGRSLGFKVPMTLTRTNMVDLIVANMILSGY